ncbi:uncharacterized protein Z519_07387 [Cladophialophora bantiana CBS 173.52]|uniref:Uncharacterized protein n=1 Tax=Cladophialophora bantiana (strain ATCC 10958 / CBS 173.52 / CDC B-1940 / NIH 8579) TaxID=1442370 RepID=A0A0D2HGK3_CLAB1|nr:uncharacterized protein Z519_07387 [Cladophialophora bantiana CBS 173.52]KIW92403.1 hypothetical protein Z519_07387 [Cladophialophora bantiana CBS 173.52]
MPKFKFHKELMKDLVLPQLSSPLGLFLNCRSILNFFQAEVNSPEIYQKAMNLVNLWKAKSAIAQRRPFDVKNDLYKLAYDIIITISFGLSDQLSCTRMQLNASLSEQPRYHY